MTDYTSTAYGVGDSRKGSDKSTAALRNPLTKMSKGQQTMRFVVSAEDEIMGGEIYVNKGTTVAANDTFTITVTAG
jgi:hypothetical protein